MPPIASNFVEVVERALLHIEGQPLHKIRSTQRVDGIGNARFIGQDLLRAQGDAGRIFRRQGEGFVKAVGMQALRAAQHRGQGLDRHPRDIVLGLLGGQRDACRLGMKPHTVGADIPGAKALGHQPVPDLARGPEFADLFEKIVMRIEEEAQPRSEIIDLRVPGAAPTPRTPRRRRE